MTNKPTSIAKAVMIHMGKLICWAFSFSDNNSDCYTARQDKQKKKKKESFRCDKLGPSFININLVHINVLYEITALFFFSRIDFIITFLQ